jgi:DNA polymerase III epsilon subunit-like protein
MKVNKIAFETIKNAPSLKAVLKKFEQKFSPKKVIFAYYGGPVDPDFLRAGFIKAGMKFTYDYHFFNIWGLFYTFFALKGMLNNRKRFSGFSLEDAMEYFKIKSGSRHDAMEDAIIEAKILQKIVKELKS